MTTEKRSKAGSPEGGLRMREPEAGRHLGYVVAEVGDDGSLAFVGTKCPLRIMRKTAVADLHAIRAEYPSMRTSRLRVVRVVGFVGGRRT